MPKQSKYNFKIWTFKLLQGGFLQYLRIVDFPSHVDRVINEICEVERVYFCVDTAPPLDVQHRDKVECGGLYLLQQIPWVIMLVKFTLSYWIILLSLTKTLCKQHTFTHWLKICVLYISNMTACKCTLNNIFFK